MDKKGKAIIFTAPSGAGKTTIVKHLLHKYPALEFSISAVTRDKRGRTEIDGKDYYFLSKESFRKKIEQGEFIEWEEVYMGNYYGTLISEVQRIWNKGKTVIFDVDVKGAQKLKEYFKDQALSVFVKVPDMATLEKRLRDRKTESEQSISQRLYRAEFEMGFEKKFDYTLINDGLEKSLPEAEKLIGDFLK